MESYNVDKTIELKFYSQNGYSSASIFTAGKMGEQICPTATTGLEGL